MAIELRALSLGDGDDVYDFLQELGPGENGFGNMAYGLNKQTEFPNYLKRNYDIAAGENLPDGLVPQTTFWLIVDGEMVGLGKLRHCLNEKLERAGGHIGYSIKQSARGKGYGTEILRLLLIEAKALGIDEVLLTINEGNLTSQRTAKRNGGVLREVIDATGFWVIQL